MSYRDRLTSVRKSVPGLLAIMLGISACGPVPEEEIESKSSALITPTPLNVGHIDRVRGVDQRCSLYRCLKYVNFNCVQYTTTCENQVFSDRLYANSNAYNNNWTFPPYQHTGTPAGTYRGCGPQAALNVLSWFGVKLSLDYVASQIVNIDWPASGQIGTTPDALVVGLQSLLDRYASGRFQVRRNRGGPDAVAAAVTRTKNPVIVLANSGGHYLTATGWTAYTRADNWGRVYSLGPGIFHVIDYPWNGAFTRTGGELRMEFEGLPAWIDFFNLNFMGYDPNTYITIERSGDILEAGQRLNHGRTITSPDGRFRLEQQTDGNLVLYRWDNAALWATNLWGAYTEMQVDGNLVVYDEYRNAVWASATHGNWDSYLRMQDDGNLVIYRRDGQAIWHSGTWGY
jgi:hypothetical protein